MPVLACHQPSSTIEVRRANSPCPEGALCLLHPDALAFVPSQYSLDNLRLTYYCGQEKRPISGGMLYDRLRWSGLLRNCLGFADGRALVALGISLFRERFGEKSPTLWSSVCIDRDGDRAVPIIENHDDALAIALHKLTEDWDADRPALHFF